MNNDQHCDNAAESGNHIEEQPTPAEYCPNCHASLYGQWCYKCGQSQKPIDRFFFSLVAEAFEDIFSWDSRAARTLGNLLFRPGFLTREYFAGRRARYVPPLRLYIIASVLFFFVLSLQTVIDGNGTTVVAKDGSIYIDIEGDKGIGDIADDSRQDTESIQSARMEKILQSLNTFEIGWLSHESNLALRERLKIQAVKFEQVLREDPGEIGEIFLDVAPPVLFVLLPLFALLLKLFYITSGRYYTEHLILAVHNHSFLFIILIIDTPIVVFEDSVAVLGYLQTTIQIWIIIYMYLSLKFVYGQGYFITFIKYVVLGASYSVMAVVGLAVTFLLGILTL